MTISREHGLIAHLSIDAGTCRLIYVDIAAGRAHGDAIVNAVDAWTSRADVFSVDQAADEPTFTANTGPTMADVAALTPADEQNAVRQRPTPDERDTVDDGTYKALKARYQALGPDAATWVKGLVADAIAAGVSFHMSQVRTHRRWEILRATVLIAEQGSGDDDLRGYLKPIIGDCAQFASVPCGHLLGSLSATEATQLAGLVDGTLTLAFDDGGKARLQPAA